MLNSKGPFTLTENSWSDTSIYDGAGRRVALLCIKYDCDENSQGEFEKRQAADAAVIVEALNVHEATGLTPAQLQARVAELEGALAAESARLDWLNQHRDGFFNLDRVTSILGKGFASGSPTSWHADVRGVIDEARNA